MTAVNSIALPYAVPALLIMQWVCGAHGRRVSVGSERPSQRLQGAYIVLKHVPVTGACVVADSGKSDVLITGARIVADNGESDSILIACLTEATKVLIAPGRYVV